MSKLVNPSELLEGASVAWFTVNDPQRNPAWIAKVEGEKNVFDATVNEFWLNKVKPGERRLFDYCLRLHEVLHVRYETFTYEITNELHRVLFNLFEDVRIEFMCMMEFPGLVPYFNAMFGFITEAIASYPTTAEQVANDVQILLDHLRLGKLSPDNWLVQFVEPRLEVVRRGNVDGAYLLATQVLALILQVSDVAYEIKIARGVTGEGGTVARTPEQKKLVEKAASRLGKSGDNRTVGDVCEGKEGGPGSGVVSEEFAAHRDPRWDQVVGPNAQNITTIQQALRRLYNKVVLVEAKRGDLNLAPHRMQQAFVDSFGDGEVTAPYFRVFRRHEVKVDVLLLVDQSGSIGSNAAFVSDTCILTAAAVAGVKSARIAAAGFGKSSGTLFIKEFASPSWFGNYAPVSDGGTPMGQTMKDVAANKRYAWRRDAKRLVIVLTDGQPDSWTTVNDALELEYYKDVASVPVCVGGAASGHYANAFKRKPVQIHDLSEAANAIFEVLVGEVSPWTGRR